MNSRRGFLQSLIAAGVTAAVDPDKLLWEPGRKLISIPKPRLIVNGFRVGDTVTFEGHYRTNPLTLEPLPILQRFIVTDPRMSLDGYVIATFKALPIGPEDFQAAALAARGSVVDR